MGLIKAAVSAIGSTLHDQWKEAIRCEEMGNDILMMKKTTKNGVISNGSTIISTSKMIKSSLICSSIATAIFIIIGVCSHRKPQKNREASKYISKPLKLTEQTDQFLDKHVSQTRRVESSSSSGESSGSSTHSGSSGTSHGGGGRSF